MNNHSMGFAGMMLMLLVTASTAESQIQSKSSDLFEELESGNLTLRFFNALNGSSIEGGTVAIEAIGTYTTDDEGKVVFPPPETDTVLNVLFTAEGYLPTSFPVEIMAQTVFFNRISISPMMDITSFRVVLDWDKQPLDLDAHFVKTGEYHLSYRNMRVLADGSGMLDIDAMNGYGPETITVNDVAVKSEYVYSVADYTNRQAPSSRALSRSKATVKVYGGGKLLNVFQVPRNAEGNVWTVFTVAQGQIREMRQLKTQ